MNCQRFIQWKLSIIATAWFTKEHECDDTLRRAKARLMCVKVSMQPFTATVPRGPSP